MRQYIRLCLSALLMLGISCTAFAEPTPAETAAAAVTANPGQAAEIAADAVAKNPEQAAAIIEAILAVCPECTAISIDPAFKRKKCTAKDNSNYCSCVHATMAVVNAALETLPSAADAIVDAASDNPGYDPDMVAPPGNPPGIGTNPGLVGNNPPGLVGNNPGQGGAHSGGTGGGVSP